MLSAVLERDVRSVELQANEETIGSLEDKHIRFDGKCMDKDTEEVIEAEMQVDREYKDGVNWMEYFGKRALHYGSRLYLQQLFSGVNYGLLRRVIQITFCDFVLYPDTKNFRHVFVTISNDGYVLSRAITYVVVELQKVERFLESSVETLIYIDKWSIFLKYADNERHRGFINEVISSKEGLKMASKVVSSIVRSREETFRRLE